MSGIYIPGMEMPKSCILCDLSHEDGWCPVKKDYIDRYSFETCPLVPVPPHGDLIERDKLVFEDDIYGWRDKQVVKAAPTVIPESGMEGET